MTTTLNTRVILPREVTDAEIEAAHNAMFEEPYTCETDPMIGAGLDAARTAAPASGKVTEAELENVAITLFDLSWFIDDAPASENGERIGNTTWTTFESGVASALADPDKYLVGARMRFHDLLSEQERKRWMMLARAALSAIGLEVEG